MMSSPMTPEVTPEVEEIGSSYTMLDHVSEQTDSEQTINGKSLSLKIEQLEKTMHEKLSLFEQFMREKVPQLGSSTTEKLPVENSSFVPTKEKPSSDDDVSKPEVDFEPLPSEVEARNSRLNELCDGIEDFSTLLTYTELEEIIAKLDELAQKYRLTPHERFKIFEKKNPNYGTWVHQGRKPGNETTASYDSMVKEFLEDARVSAPGRMPYIFKLLRLSHTKSLKEYYKEFDKLVASVKKMRLSEELITCIFVNGLSKNFQNRIYYTNFPNYSAAYRHCQHLVNQGMMTDNQC